MIIEEKRIIGQPNYRLLQPDIKKCQIQVKDKSGSESFTLYGYDNAEIINRIIFLFKELEKTNDFVKIVHYKRRQTETTK